MRQKFISLKKQSGVAAIWLGLSLVPIMGFTFWAVEGTRYVQESSRLRDATEAAALAVTIQDTENSSVEMSEQYVQAYVRDIDSLSVSTTRLFQEADEENGDLEFVQYTVDGLTSHKSWFSSHFIPSFGENQNIAGRSLARKYPTFLGDKAIDIVFVADFSGSMNWNWAGGGKKIDDLKVAVQKIAEKVLCSYDDYCEEGDNRINNRVGIVPFNVRTRELNSNSAAFNSTQLRYNDEFEQVNWNKWRQYGSAEIYNCSRKVSSCPSGTDNEKNQASIISSVLSIKNGNKNSTYFLDLDDNVDYQKTVSDMMINKYPDVKTFYRAKNVSLYKGYGDVNDGQFYNINLTSDIDFLSDFNSMWANGNTAAFQGILRGVQILANGNPHSDDEEEQEEYNEKVKMLLILSDGQESPNNDILKKLVQAEMCDRARENIDGLYIGVIGIDFNASQQGGFQDCVIDEENDIIDVYNLDDLIEKIEELIRKGSQTNGVTKLY